MAVLFLVFGRIFIVISTVAAAGQQFTLPPPIHKVSFFLPSDQRLLLVSLMIAVLAWGWSGNSTIEFFWDIADSKMQVKPNQSLVKDLSGATNVNFKSEITAHPCLLLHYFQHLS